MELPYSVSSLERSKQRQVAVLQWRGEQQTTKGRHGAETIPLIDSKDDGPGFAVAGDDRRLSMRRAFYQG